MAAPTVKDAAVRGEFLRVKLPKGTCSVSIEGVDIEVPKSGIVEVATHIGRQLCESFGGEIFSAEATKTKEGVI